MVIKSITDVITNSSSETFLIKTDKSFEELGMDQVFATKKELENKFKELVDGNEVEY